MAELNPIRYVFSCARGNSSEGWDFVYRLCWGNESYWKIIIHTPWTARLTPSRYTRGDLRMLLKKMMEKCGYDLEGWYSREEFKEMNLNDRHIRAVYKERN